MKLSVVIPTYNRRQQLKQVLEGLAAQSYQPDWFEVVVVSDGSSDGTNEYLKQAEFPFRLRPVLQRNQGVATARNRGVSEAQGDLVLFLDDDVVPAPNLIEEHLQRHENVGDNVVVMGPMLTPDDHEMTPWVAWEQEMLMKQYNDMEAGRWDATARQFYTGNTSLRRRWLEETGGFDPSFRRAEDVELAYRLAEEGVHFVFNREAVGYHYAVRSFESWMATPYAYGRNDVIFTREKGQNWLLPTIFHEFHGRHPLIRGLTWLALDRQRLSQLLIKTMHEIGQMADRMGQEQVARMAYSGIFNLRHYQGIADELGGRRSFFERVQQNKVESADVPGALPSEQAANDTVTERST